MCVHGVWAWVWVWVLSRAPSEHERKIGSVRARENDREREAGLQTLTCHLGLKNKKEREADRGAPDLDALADMQEIIPVEVTQQGLVARYIKRPR